MIQTCQCSGITATTDRQTNSIDSKNAGVGIRFWSSKTDRVSHKALDEPQLKFLLVNFLSFTILTFYLYTSWRLKKHLQFIFSNLTYIDKPFELWTVNLTWNDIYTKTLKIKIEKAARIAVCTILIQFKVYQYRV